MSSSLSQRFAMAIAVLLTVAAAMPSAADTWKSDPNLPDTLLVPSFSWRGDTLVAIDIYAATDDSLSVAQFVLTWENPALRINSVDMTVGRWNVVGYHRWTKAGANDGVVVAFLPTQMRLPPGAGPVARLYFGRDSAYVFDADFTMGAGIIAPIPPLANYETTFADLAGEPYLPTHLQTATVTFSPCYCDEHGKVAEGENITAIDLNAMIDDIFFSALLPPTDPYCPHIHRGDYNCDNSYDALDLNAIIDYLFFSGDAPCDPCEDLP